MGTLQVKVLKTTRGQEGASVVQTTRRSSSPLVLL